MRVFRPNFFLDSFQDGRSPMSSGAESDDSSGPDSPSVVLPIRTASAATQQQLQQFTRSSVMEPNGLQGLVAQQQQEKQQQHANGNSNSATGGVSIRMSNSKSSSQQQPGQTQATGSAAAAAINLAGIVGTLSRLDGLVSDIPSGLYPPSAFQHIPPEIVMQLVEMGHLKFHSNEGKLSIICT